MRIVLLGPPGSGKGKLSERISAHYGVPIINAANLVDRAAAEQSELGRLAKDAMDMGRISDELLLALLRIRLGQPDVANGFVLFDLPRNAGQADVIDSVLDDLGRPVELALVLDVDPDELMERLVGRIQCDNCGAEYNLYINPPIVDDVCDFCGARASRRPDDYEETISNRLRIYEGLLGPLQQYYQLSDKLRHIDGDGTEEQVWKLAKKIIDKTPRIEVAEPVEPESAPAAAPASKAAPKKAGAAKSAVAKPAVKKAAAKKSAAEKTASGSKATAKTTQKAPTKKAATKKKAPAKKVAVKKAAAKKAAVKKAAAKKVVAKKAVAKKAAAKKAVTKKKPVAKKAVAKKVASKKAAAKKSSAKKAVAKKSFAKAAAKKKPAAKKAVAKKTAPKKSTAKQKPATKKQASTKKKAVAKKSPAAKKAPAKKVAAKKVAKKKVVVKAAGKKQPAAKKTAKKKAVKKRR